jgi:hypothetical protein
MADPDQALADEYQKLPEEDQVLIYVGCEKIADFSEIAFMQRDLFPSDDWDTWWRYMADTYDEAPSGGTSSPSERIVCNRR